MGMLRRVARRTARRTTRRTSRRRFLLGTGIVATAAGVGYMANRARRNAAAQQPAPQQSTAAPAAQDSDLPST